MAQLSTTINHFQGLRITVNEQKGAKGGEHKGTLLLLHGWPDDEHIWEAQVAWSVDRNTDRAFTLP